MRSHLGKTIGTIWLLLLAPCCAFVYGGYYRYELPQLVGDYPTAGYQEVLVELGLEFAEIDNATLLLTGTQLTGSYGDLNSPGVFPLPADIYGYFSQPESTKNAWAESFLPAVSGPFEFEQSFRVCCGDTQVDYSQWLAGVADFQFGVSEPFLIATTFVISHPQVTIDSAALLIQGQPNLDSFMLPGDLNGDGQVDGDDFLEVQRNDPSLIAMWKADFGASHGHAALAIPEASALLLANCGFLGLALWRRHGRTMICKR